MGIRRGSSWWVATDYDSHDRDDQQVEREDAWAVPGEVYRPKDDQTRMEEECERHGQAPLHGDGQT